MKTNRHNIRRQILSVLLVFNLFMLNWGGVFAQHIIPDNQYVTIDNSNSQNGELVNHGHLTISTPLQISTYKQLLSHDYSAHLPTLICNAESSALNVELSKYIETQYYWYFISLPIDAELNKLSFIQYGYNNEHFDEEAMICVRQYNGAKRAFLRDDFWEDLNPGDRLKAGKGYILKVGTPYWEICDISFKGIAGSDSYLFTSNDVKTHIERHFSELEHAGGWNLIGNPYPCYFDIKGLSHKGPIITWEPYENRYVAVSTIDDNYMLKPYQAFFVQYYEDEYVVFDADYRSHEPEPLMKSKPLIAQNSERKIINLYLRKATNNYVLDQARLVINPNAKTDYEKICDAIKMDSPSKQEGELYLLESGLKYAIDERPVDGENINLGYSTSETDKYTLAAEAGQDVQITLIDKDLQTEINLNDRAYEFTSKSGKFTSRFALRVLTDVTKIIDFETLPEETVEIKYYKADGTYAGADVNHLRPGLYIRHQGCKTDKIIIR